MSYVVESGSSQRSRKRRRTAITLLVVVALLAAAFYYASAYFKTGGQAARGACVTPTAGGTGATSGGRPNPSQITLNVYNATKRVGLAGATAKVLKDRGFVVAKIANDPVNKKVPQPAEIRFGKAGELAAQVVLPLVAGAVPVNDGRADGSVDLVLGDGFKELAPAAAAAPGTPAPATPPAPGATGGSTAAPTTPGC